MLTTASTILKNKIMDLFLNSLNINVIHYQANLAFH